MLLSPMLASANQIIRRDNHADYRQAHILLRSSKRRRKDEGKTVSDSGVAQSQAFLALLCGSPIRKGLHADNVWDDVMKGQQPQSISKVRKTSALPRYLACAAVQVLESFLPVATHSRR